MLIRERFKFKFLIVPLIASRIFGSSSRKSLKDAPVSTVSLSSFRLLRARLSSAPYIPTSFGETSSLNDFISRNNHQKVHLRVGKGLKVDEQELIASSEIILLLKVTKSICANDLTLCCCVLAFFRLLSFELFGIVFNVRVVSEQNRCCDYVETHGANMRRLKTVVSRLRVALECAS